eukprot:TRINITY_DN901_c0_g1_i1.p1 TRINITY_DN901_c0_g1~~TRINITY_DN901_c0_g1_i1.p1  ORF type:complete len:495 (-),score=115.90 TRINITY_DN901_c0_g1_i1:67-1551(-)
MAVRIVDASIADSEEELPPNAPENTLTVRDNRTGRIIKVPIVDGTVAAPLFRQLRISEDDFGLMVFDPGYLNTATCRSAISYIDGDRGILRYRGYPIEELAEKSTFLEVSYLLLYGELPTKTELDHWVSRIMRHTFIHENMTSLLRTFRYDAHPMGMLISATAAMSTFHAEANPALQGVDLYKDKKMRAKQIYRILGKLPTIAACAYRHRIGRPYNYPVNHLGYTENFLYMLDRLSENDYVPNPVLARALDTLFIIHAEHEMNCSTSAARHIASSMVDPYSMVSGAASALFGPLHGGANEAVLHMLEEIGSVDRIPEFIQDVKNKKRKLMGFGHRVYKNYDPRAKILKKTCHDVFQVLGQRDKLLDVAMELEKIALTDEYFKSRKLYPNVDFYSGLIYKAMGFPTDMFPVLFTIPRAAGWLAHWIEQLDDPELRIARPRQVYTGHEIREWVDIKDRDKAETPKSETKLGATGEDPTTVRRRLSIFPGLRSHSDN